MNNISNNEKKITLTKVDTYKDVPEYKEEWEKCTKYYLLQ